jgi:hypothetical protein
MHLPGMLTTVVPFAVSSAAADAVTARQRTGCLDAYIRQISGSRSHVTIGITLIGQSERFRRRP